MQSKTKLMASASIKFLMGLLLVCLLLFLPAGTLHYPCGWLLVTALFVPMFIAGVVMLFCSPQLLKGLDGYADYCRKVRYRIIPFVF